MITPSEVHEGVRFTRGAREHVESYFLKINDPNGERALWVKATILAARGEDPIAERWAIAFERGRDPVATKSTIAFGDARFDAHALDMQVDGFTLTRSHARDRSSDELSFDLALEDAGEPFLFYPYARMYEGRFPSSKLTSPMPDLRARGTIRVGDRQWRVDDWPGLLGHNWGRSHALAYAWGHCNAWDGDHPGVVFEGTSARVRIGPLATPTTTLLCVRAFGETHMLTTVPDLLHNRGAMTYRRWTFSGRAHGVAICGELFADTRDMVGLHYENPDGAMTYCLNSKLASARIELSVRGRHRVLESRAAALEIGTRDPQHGVTMVL
jgi:hypothetical protein